jgi:hypothetical protein
MRERIKMLAPTHSVHDTVLADLRALLHVWPVLVAYPERLAKLLGVNEYVVQYSLEALKVEGEVLA